MKQQLLKLSSAFFTAALLFGSSQQAQAQHPLTAANPNYIQNFDSFGATGTTHLPNWSAIKAAGTSAAPVGSSLNPLVTTGTANSGAVYNVGNSADRAFGTLASGSVTPRFGIGFVNNTSKTITSVDLKGVMEQWRTGTSTAVNEVVVFEYSFSATSINDGTWIKLPGFDLVEKLTGSTTSTSLDGNTAANRTNISGSLTNIAWPAGTQLWVRWTDKDDSGSDGIYAIDEFELITGSVSDAVAPVLAVNPFSPATGAIEVDMGTTLSISFSEAIAKGTGFIQVQNTTDNTTQQIALTDVTIVNDKATFAANLLPGKVYSVSIEAGVIQDLAGNAFAGLTAGDWTFTTEIPNPFAQNFNKCVTNLPGGWFQYSVTGGETWVCTPFGQSGSAVQMNGFNGGAKENEDWLISQPFDLSSGFTYPLLSFASRVRFGGESLKLLVSTNYSGTGNPKAATWKEINGVFPALDSDVWTLSENINLSKFKSDKVFIAFVYTSNTSAAARWTIDNVAITNSEVAPPKAPVYFISSLSPLTNFDFGFISTSGPTPAKSFTFSALDLRTDLTVTAPANFELSKDGTNYAASLTFNPDEAFETNNVFIRFANTATKQGAFAGSISFSSQDFSKKDAYLTATTLPKDKTLDVVTWNIEWFGHSGLGPADNALQLANAKKMILAQDAEIYCLEEIVNENLFKQLVSELPGYRGFLSPYVSGSPGPNTQKVGFLYKTSAVDSVTTRGLLQSPANPSNFWASGRLPYLFVADATVEGVKKRLHLIAIHAKANENSTPADALDAYNRRISDLKVLKDTLDTYYADANIMMLGDFNDDVDFTVANVPNTASTYSVFTDDAANYTPVTLPLSQAGLRSYIAFENIIDHVLVSNEIAGDHLAYSSRIIIPFDLIQNYQSTTSDHLPVTTRFVLTPDVAFATATEVVSEEQGIYNLTINLSRASVKDQTLQVAVTPGAGITTTDYQTATDNIYSVTIPAGATSVTLPVSIVNDTQVELDETLTFTVANVTGSYGFLATESFTLTVQDNDASLVSFTTAAVELAESAGTFNVTLNLDQPTVSEQTFTLTTENGSGVQYGTDYITAPASIGSLVTVTIPAGASAASFALQIQDDNLVELSETITFKLTEASAKLGIGIASEFKATITDNDVSVINFSAATASISENAGSYLVTLTLDQAPVTAQTVTVNLTNSSNISYSLAKGNYTTQPSATNGQLTLTIPAGETSVSFVVLMDNDTRKEKDKQVKFTLSNVSAGLVMGNTTATVLTITDETNPNVKGTQSENGLTVAPNPSEGNVTLTFRDAAVYLANNLTLTLWNAQGQNIVTVTGDVETVTAKLNQLLQTAPAGMYIVKVVNGSVFYQERLIRN